MKGNGFTLIELLAVIVVLSIIFSIVIITIGNTITDSKNSLSKTQKNIIEHAAQTYYIEEGRNNNITCISLISLADKGYLKRNNIKDPKTNEIMNGSINITLSDGDYLYEYTEDSCNICKAVKVPTTGNVPSGNYTYGDEYTCEVGNNYSNTFFVIENNSDTVSLIMKENYTDSYVPKKLAWCIDGGTTNDCKNIGTTGSSVPLDKNYLGHIKSIFNKSEVEVSFPTKDQIYKAAGNKTSNLPIWLYDYLSGTTNSVAVGGYWTVTFPDDVSDVATRVYSSGYIQGDFVEFDNNGLRPVITIPKSEID